MAITIRNTETEQIIRQIGRETGEGASALINRWARAARDNMEREKQERLKQRREAVEAWLASLPRYSDEDRAEMHKIMDDMYDEWGHPK